MAYVQRENGEIVGVFAQRQPGFAEEELPDDHKDIAAFREHVALLFDGGMLSPPPVLPAHVDAERERRIAVLLTAATGVEHTPDSAHRAVDDGAREATRLLNLKVEHLAGIGPDWTPEQADRAAELKELDASVMAIEEAAASLRAMEPIPSDYRDDGYWP